MALKFLPLKAHNNWLESFFKELYLKSKERCGIDIQTVTCLYIEDTTCKMFILEDVYKGIKSHFIELIQADMFFL